MTFLLQHLLIESAARAPHNTALRFQDRSLTYGELDKQTNQVARALRAAGVGPGDRVGIYLHKSLASVISIFGILKAGGVYVPLDAGAPTRRLAYITRNCDVRTALTSAQMLPKLQEFFAEGTPLETVLLIDEQEAVEPLQGATLVTWDEVISEADEPVSETGVIETDLAYILYTSGSTGDPKGVMISHRTIFTFINWCFETFHVSESDRVTSHAPLHFDLSTFDIFVTTKAGAVVVLVPEKLSIFPVRLARLLQDERITLTYMVPSILSLLVSYGNLPSYDLSALRAILFAGEVFPIKYLRRLVDMVPHADYYNLYGPTETNVCTYYKVQGKDLDPQRSEPVPIGRACENIAVFAVNEGGQLVTALGEEGELWVRGSCVAQGYWGDEDKTAAGFVRNPFQPNFEEVAYRTGDIVVLDEDGENWRFVGRRDHMIKSRGYRIELGEIESALYAHEGIKETAVVAIPDELVGSRIKAVVVLIDGCMLDEKEIQEHCGRYLPHYMVPELVEIRAFLPKTSTGKVDRRGLVLSHE